jgi:transketolase
MGILGKTEELLKLEPLHKKFQSFGFETHTIDGHNFEVLRQVFKKHASHPRVIIANTIKGKGVSYMEDVWQYHTIIPKSDEDIEQGIEELS